MHSQARSLSSPFRTISFAVIAPLLTVVAMAPSWAQNSVPPTAVQAAKMPEFASRLAHPVKRPGPATSSALARAKTHRGPLDSSDIYDNGPTNGNADAWTINFGFITSDSFNVSAASATLTGMTFAAWLFPGDTLTSAEVSITSGINSGTSYFDQTVNFTQGTCTSNQYGYNVCTETTSFTGPALNAGTYWVNLQNASVPSGDPIYWDENSGPSSADQNAVGTIPSESFTILGSETTTSVDCTTPEDLHILYDFTGETDGSSPNGVSGVPPAKLYGATNGGYGSAFQLSQAGSGWTLNSLYNFAGGTDGSAPSVPIIGPNGTLYGSARNCDQDSCSLAFDLVPQPTVCLTAMCRWSKTVLYQFNDIAGISAIDEDGNLYGTDQSGGAQGLGAIFELTPSIGYWTKTILYNFTGGDDGYSPGAVLLGRDGNLYGRALGGAYGNGVVFQLLRSQSGWTENTIVAFQTSNDNAFYFFPDLVQDSSGNFYFVRGDYRTDQNGWYVDGIIYKLFFLNGQWNITQALYIAPGTWDAGVNVYDLSADHTDVFAAANAWVYDCFGTCPVELFNNLFDPRDQQLFLGADFVPNGPMVSDDQGYIYGTSGGCGTYGYGTVWRWTPSGSFRPE